jgi:hypothetical protein
MTRGSISVRGTFGKPHKIYLKNRREELWRTLGPELRDGEGIGMSLTYFPHCNALVQWSAYAT